MGKEMKSEGQSVGRGQITAKILDHVQDFGINGELPNNNCMRQGTTVAQHCGLSEEPVHVTLELCPGDLCLPAVSVASAEQRQDWESVKGQ